MLNAMKKVIHTLYSLTTMLLIFLSGIDSFAMKYTIDVKNFAFAPSSLPTVRIGDTIHWVWVEGMHTTTSSTIPAGAATWDQMIDVDHLSFDYIPTILGVYNYVCTPHVTLGMTGSFTVISPSGIADVKPVPSFSAYPNPVRDQVTLHLSNDVEPGIHSLKIADGSGRIIRDMNLTINSGQTEYSFSLQEFPDGLLEFILTDPSGNFTTRKIIHKN
jgi:plastocyanin